MPTKTSGRSRDELLFQQGLKILHTEDSLMALKSTVFKVEVQIADMDRNYYHTHVVTIARHPSETDERMMIRMLAFVLHASDSLAFANGLTSSDEPDLWEKDLTGSIVLWIMVGRPDEKQIKKACSRSERVVIYSYGISPVDVWWSSIGQSERFNNLTVMNVPMPVCQALADLVERSMKVHCTIQDGVVWLSTPNATVEINLTTVF